MTGVSEQNGPQVVIFAGDRHHGYGVINRAHQCFSGSQQGWHIGLTIVSPVHREGRSALAGVDRCRFQVGQGATNQVDADNDHPVGVSPDEFFLGFLDLVIVNQVFTQPGATVIV